MKHAKAEGQVETSPKEAARSRVSSAADRRLDLVRAAYGIIAAQGFEGLRTRGIVAVAGVNIATLHYYFPTKEALIGAVAEYLVSQFISVRSPPVEPRASAALTRLRQEFADARLYQAERPDILIVIQELTLRARRDPGIARILAPLMNHWRGEIEAIIGAGIGEGAFRSELDPGIAASIVTSTLMGAANLALAGPTLDGVFAEIEAWLTAKP
jgi:AcrR family transcriptional regulator